MICGTFAKGGGKGVGIIKNDSAAVCGACHTRGADDTKIIAKDGKFIDHHEQYPELLNSPHKGSHIGQTNPTEGANIEAQCPSYHAQQIADFTGSTMQKAGVKCIDCHMPAIGESATGDAAKFKADVKTHLFKINTNTSAKMFTDDGKFANRYLTLEWTCLSCHNDENKAWAGQYAKGIHKFVKAEATATPAPTPKTPAFEALIAISALLVAVLVRRR